jgi:hypothetical protein
MSLGSVTPITWGNAANGVDATIEERRALIVEEITGMVEGTIKRRSVMQGIFPNRMIRGTDTISAQAVGASQLQKLQPGVALPGIKSDFAKAFLTVDTVVAARENFALLDDLQTNTNRKAEVAEEQGKEISKFYDAAHMIQAIKAARSTESAFNMGQTGKPRGHGTGNRLVLANAADVLDPDLFYKAFTDLFVKMQLQDVDPVLDGVIAIVNPQEYNTLAHAEHLINMDYTTAAGSVLQNQAVLKAAGVPVFSSNNLPQEVISGHMLSNSTNNNGYDGDFSKVSAAVFGPKALLTGETISVTSDVFFDKVYKCWFVDSWLSFGAAPMRVEYAGVIERP